MLSAANRIEKFLCRSCYQFRPAIAIQLRNVRTDSRSPSSPNRRRPKFTPISSLLKKGTEDKSEWWVVDGEMHEIGDNVPPRERFMIPRENIPNRRRKQLREQYMRRTRLIIKENEHESWCKRYMELYNEIRENWERLYWDEGYSKKLARDHANYDTSEDDDEDFNPNNNTRRPQSFGDQFKSHGFVRQHQQEGGNNTWQNVSQIRDKFEYDREKRMREKAFAPMSRGGNNDFNARGDRDRDRDDGFQMYDSNNLRNNTPFDARREKAFEPMSRGGNDDFNACGGRDRDRDRDDGFRMYDSNDSRNNTPFDARREKAFEPMSRGGNNDFNARGGRDRDRDDGFQMYDSNNSRNNTPFDARKERAFEPMSRGGNNDFNARGGRDRDDGFRTHDSNNSGNNTPFDARSYDFDSGSESAD